jgi:hypothetical protein
MSSTICTAHGQQKVSFDMGQHLATPRSLHCLRRERTSKAASANHHLECTHTLPRRTARRGEALLLRELLKLGLQARRKTNRLSRQSLSNILTYDYQAELRSLSQISYYGQLYPLQSRAAPEALEYCGGVDPTPIEMC